MEANTKLYICRTNSNQSNHSKAQYRQSRVSAASKFLQKDIFKLRYTDLQISPKLKHLKHGFVDENDFEDFKQDLLDFNDLKRRSREILDTDFDFDSFKTADSRKSRNISGDQLMEFFNSDEHFKEFERVFETFKSKRFSGSVDKIRWSLNKYGESSDEDEEEEDDDKTIMLEDDIDVIDDLDLDDSNCDDIFNEFFDNDEDFKEFEREFQTFKIKRRSRALEKLNRRSGCDIVTELKAICDRDPMEKYDALAAAGEPRLWNSGGEWDFIFHQLKRNSRLSSDRSGIFGSSTSIATEALSENDKVFISTDNLAQESGNCSDYNKGAQNENDCNFTCHQNCAPLVRLGCKSSPQSEVPEDEAVSLETSLSETSDSSQSTPVDGSTEAPTEKDETDSGYRSGTIPDEKLPRKPSQATLNREELRKKLDEYNTLVPDSKMQLNSEKTETFQGFVKVVLNLIRPICMSLGSRPPSFYEVLTQEHIVEQNTQTISFYMPRDTVKSIHIFSDASTKDVVALLLKKFHILDNPRKFALYEQELNLKGKIAKLRRIPETDLPLHIALDWDSEKISRTRFVLQENENGEIDWEAFSPPELNNFLRVLDREESEYVEQLKYKYKVMDKIIRQRMKELRKEKNQEAKAKRDSLYGKQSNQGQRQSLAES